ncbi:MAG: ribosomal protein small subunit ribosomal protein [Candidatus Parcubacteria bacterium]|jgi:small subunit ribosomal protein S4
MRYTGPKNRLSRREGLDLGHKTPGAKSHASLLKKLNVFPGQHGTKGRRKVSDTGKQLREKQKLRFMWGISESQLKRYFQQAKRKTGNTGLHLSAYLERRLDNAVYRLGLAPTRASARQLVSHKHFKVNDKIVNVASYSLRVGDVITFAKDKTTKLPPVEAVLAKKDTAIPEWFERMGPAGKVISEPSSALIEKMINLRLVIEFYSR